MFYKKVREVFSVKNVLTVSRLKSQGRDKPPQDPGEEN